MTSKAFLFAQPDQAPIYAPLSPKKLCRRQIFSPTGSSSHIRGAQFSGQGLFGEIIQLCNPYRRGMTQKDTPNICARSVRCFHMSPYKTFRFLSCTSSSYIFDRICGHTISLSAQHSDRSLSSLAIKRTPKPFHACREHDVLLFFRRLFL